MDLCFDPAQTISLLQFLISPFLGTILNIKACGTGRSIFHLYSSDHMSGDRKANTELVRQCEEKSVYLLMTAGDCLETLIELK